MQEGSIISLLFRKNNVLEGGLHTCCVLPIAVRAPDSLCSIRDEHVGKHRQGGEGGGGPERGGGSGPV